MEHVKTLYWCFHERGFLLVRLLPPPLLHIVACRSVCRQGCLDVKCLFAWTTLRSVLEDGHFAQWLRCRWPLCWAEWLFAKVEWYKRIVGGQQLWMRGHPDDVFWAWFSPKMSKVTTRFASFPWVLSSWAVA